MENLFLGMNYPYNAEARGQGSIPLTVNFSSGGHFLMHKSSFIVQLADFAFLLGVFWDAM